MMMMMMVVMVVYVRCQFCCCVHFHEKVIVNGHDGRAEQDQNESVKKEKSDRIRITTGR